MAAAILTQDRLRELLHYNPDTGVFTWLVSRQGSGAKPGKRAGVVGRNGYVYIGVDRGRYLAHRLAFLFMDGAIPPELVDHKDGDKQNNRWANLRHANKRLNAQNIRVAAPRSKTGLLGASFSTRNKTNPWLAQIKKPDGATKNLGYYATPEEAHAAYLAAKRVLHLGCTI